jgi:hypothetical protein
VDCSIARNEGADLRGEKYHRDSDKIWNGIRCISWKASMYHLVVIASLEEIESLVIDKQKDAHPTISRIDV